MVAHAGLGAPVEIRGRPASLRNPPRALGVAHAVALGLAGVSPASSVFVVIAPVTVALGPTSITAFLLTLPVAVLVAMTYAAVGSRIPVNGGEPAWATNALGPGFGAALLALTLTTLTLILALFLSASASLALPRVPAVTAIVLIGGAVTVLACAELRVTVWVAVSCLVLEVLAIAAVTVHAWSVRDASPAGYTGPSCVRHALEDTSHLTLLAVPVLLFALNGYGQTAYIVEEVADGARRVGLIIGATLVATVVLEGVPLVAMACTSAVFASSESAGESLIDALTASSRSPWLGETVRWAIVVALLNAVLALLIFGSRMLAYANGRGGVNTSGGLGPLEHRPAARPRATVAVGVAMICVAVTVPAEPLVTATGSSLLFSYASVAVCALVTANAGPPRRCGRAIPAILIAVLGSMVGNALMSDPLSVLAATGLLVFGAVWFWTWSRFALAEGSDEVEGQR